MRVRWLICRLPAHGLQQGRPPRCRRPPCCASRRALPSSVLHKPARLRVWSKALSEQGHQASSVVLPYNLVCYMEEKCLEALCCYCVELSYMRSIPAQQQCAGSPPSSTKHALHFCLTFVCELDLTTDVLLVPQNAALQKLCRSLRGTASSATAHHEDPAASAPETASSADTAEVAAAGGCNGTLPQGASAAPTAPAAAGGCAVKQGEAVGGGAALEAGLTVGNASAC